MGPQDGVDYALRALASLRDDLGRDDVQAAFIGHGDAWDDLVALAHELGLDDRVEFTGRVSDEDVARYLSTADVCLAPDPKNPLNDVSTMNKIVEYMAMSRPLVSFDLVEARVSAGEAALYATPNDEREFARLVAELLDDPERRAQHGRARPPARRAGALVGALAQPAPRRPTRRSWRAAASAAQHPPQQLCPSAARPRVHARGQARNVRVDPTPMCAARTRCPRGRSPCIRLRWRRLARSTVPGLARPVRADAHGDQPACTRGSTRLDAGDS